MASCQVRYKNKNILGYLMMGFYSSAFHLCHVKYLSYTLAVLCLISAHRMADPFHTIYSTMHLPLLQELACILLYTQRTLSSYWKREWLWLMTLFVLFLFLFLLFFLCDRVSWIPGWCQTQYEGKDNLELLILMPPSPGCCGYRSVTG